MKTFTTNVLVAIAYFVVGVLFAIAGVYIGETNNTPGAAIFGLILLVISLFLSYRTLRSGRRHAQQ